MSSGLFDLFHSAVLSMQSINIDVTRHSCFLQEPFRLEDFFFEKDSDFVENGEVWCDESNEIEANMPS